ncbi:GmrSD restriction endonuclease domain-containing protein [Cognatilysobacter segetis]|uniref:GmrSD restriction endonuclease domain-containing protein n=1 Tax=Cognatilysobacter segetis TaxID=2492394 RepID=UPI00105F6552|nr:DUF262 domain-containing protein [Lysobacter segetis]
MSDTENWFDEADEGDFEVQIDEYEISASPNDFNVTTIVNFIKSGAVKIPGFQRHFVWDIKRSSKLIESLILGLPVPQVFLYEESKNSFLVIDGQQRLMSIYYFMQQRFPRVEKRAELRRIFDESGGAIPDAVLHDDEYFVPFKLKLPERLPGQPNKFNGLNYSTLGEYRVTFDLRTVRNIIVKQISPDGDDSAVFEIFNRLNSGGVNLTPQEIRASMYHSKFYDMLQRANMKPGWRSIVGTDVPDLHMKDVEVLLRSFALLVNAENYAPSMTKFLNLFSKKSKQNEQSQNYYLERLFDEFLNITAHLPARSYINERNNRFNIALFESSFYAACRGAFDRRGVDVKRFTPQQLAQLRTDKEFVGAAVQGTSKSDSVATRLRRASLLLG